MRLASTETHPRRTRPTAHGAAPRVVVVGSASRDLDPADPRGWRLGGERLYGALVLARLGLRSARSWASTRAAAAAHELDLLREAGAELVLVAPASAAPSSTSPTRRAAGPSAARTRAARSRSRALPAGLARRRRPGTSRRSPTSCPTAGPPSRRAPSSRSAGRASCASLEPGAPVRPRPAGPPARSCGGPTSSRVSAEDLDPARRPARAAPASCGRDALHPHATARTAASCSPSARGRPRMRLFPALAASRPARRHDRRRRRFLAALLAARVAPALAGERAAPRRRAPVRRGGGRGPRRAASGLAGVADAGRGAGRAQAVARAERAGGPAPERPERRRQGRRRTRDRRPSGGAPARPARGRSLGRRGARRPDRAGRARGPSRPRPRPRGAAGPPPRRAPPRRRAPRRAGPSRRSVRARSARIRSRDDGRAPSRRRRPPNGQAGASRGSAGRQAGVGVVEAVERLVVAAFAGEGPGERDEVARPAPAGGGRGPRSARRGGRGAGPASATSSALWVTTAASGPAGPPRRKSR